MGAARWSVLVGAAVKIDFDVFGGVALREEGAELFEHIGREVDIEGAAGFVVKVSVRVKIGAVAGGKTLKVYGANELVVHEGLEAVVNRGQ